MKEDGIDGIYETLKMCAQISKTAGGGGLSVSNIRAKGYVVAFYAYKHETYGVLPAALTSLAPTATRMVSCPLEPWHADVFDFLDLGRTTARRKLAHATCSTLCGFPISCQCLLLSYDFDYILMSHVSMQRIQAAGDWPLFCPALPRHLV